MARSASCCTPWSCMKRLTFMANIWAADIRPNGNVWAAAPETVFMRGPCPKRPNCPWASARNTTTHSACPVAIAAAPLAMAPEPPPPPPPHCIDAKLSWWQPSAADRRDASLRSLLYDENPSTSRGSIPASAHAFSTASMASLNSGSGDLPHL